MQGFNLSTVRRSECLPGVFLVMGGMLRERFFLSLTNLTPFAASALGRRFSCGLLFCPLWLVWLSVDNLHGWRRFVALWACFVALRAFLCVVGCVACRLSRLFCPVWRFVGWGCMFSRLACFRRFMGVFGASVAVCGFGSVSEYLQVIKKGLQRANPLQVILFEFFQNCAKCGENAANNIYNYHCGHLTSLFNCASFRLSN